MVFIDIEAAIGIWLLLGLAPTLLRRVAIGYFAALAAASIGLLFFGVPSCGCFGSATVSPWWALGLDAVAMAALATFRPKAQGGPQSAVAGWTLAGLSLIVAVEVMRHGGPTAAWVAVVGTVAVEPGRVDLGEVPAGGPHFATVTIVNRGDCDARLVGGTRNCSVNAAVDLPATIPAARTASVRVMVKGSQSGRFVSQFQLYVDDGTNWPIVGRVAGYSR
jgi:hypothetical protein